MKDYRALRQQPPGQAVTDQVIPNVQWFPGHMKKAKDIIVNNLKLVDVVIELLDARIPYSSANPMLQEIIAGKPRLVALNKSDLADRAVTKQWVEYFKKQGVPAVAVDAPQGRGIKQLVAMTEELARPMTDKLVSKGAKARAARVMILGIPNVGKSSLINRLAGSNKAKTADKPGVTRAKQWIRLGGNLELLDTPGILWPKFDDEAVGLRLAYIGSINDEILNVADIAVELIKFLQANYCNTLAQRYNIEGAGDPVQVIAQIAEKRQCIKKGGELDYDKAAALLMDDFRSGKLGRITLETP